jgi:hypothetical protein
MPQDPYNNLRLMVEALLNIKPDICKELKKQAVYKCCHVIEETYGIKLKLQKIDEIVKEIEIEPRKPDGEYYSWKHPINRSKPLLTDLPEPDLPDYLPKLKSDLE